VAHALVKNDHQPDISPRIAVLTCAVLETEIEHFAARFPQVTRI